jgi:hypothetical protein
MDERMHGDVATDVAATVSNAAGGGSHKWPNEMESFIAWIGYHLSSTVGD